MEERQRGKDDGKRKVQIRKRGVNMVDEDGAPRGGASSEDCGVWIEDERSEDRV